MGRKNRNPTPNPTPAPPAGAGAGDGGIAAVRADCFKALAYLQRGNQPKALRLLRDAAARHGEASPLLLRAQGTVHSRAAAALNDPASRARHYRAALQAARRAIELDPHSLELAHFHAMLLYEAASTTQEYEYVVDECERGLSIEAPSDPEPHSLKLPASEPEQLRTELRNLIQRTNLASISSWVKTLSGADDKLGFFRHTEDPLELLLLPAAPAPRRPNEIKKATKTVEERRKDIEVQVAALRLVEQLPHNAALAASPTPPESEEDEPPCSSCQSGVKLRRA